MKGLAAFLSWAVLGVAIGWAGAVAKAALLANDASWAGAFYILTSAIWIGGLFGGSVLIARGFQACGVWFPRALTTCCGLLAVLLCGLTDLASDYLQWRPNSPQQSGISRWFADYSRREVSVYSRRRGNSLMLQPVVFALQAGVTALIVVSGCSGLGYDPKRE